MSSRAHPRDQYRYGWSPRPLVDNAHGVPPDRIIVHAKACERKIRYETKGQARQAARQARAQYGTELTPYRCPMCGLFHLTKRD